MDVGCLAQHMLRRGRPSHQGVELLATKAARYANDAKPAAHGLQTLHTQKPQTLHLPWSRHVLYLMTTGGARLRKLAQLEVLTQLLLEVHIYRLVLNLLSHSLVLYLFYNLVFSFFVHRVFHNCFFEVDCL